MKKQYTKRDYYNIRTYAKRLKILIKISNECRQTCKCSNCNPQSCQTFQKRFSQETARLKYKQEGKKNKHKKFLIFNF